MRKRPWALTVEEAIFIRKFLGEFRIESSGQRNRPVTPAVPEEMVEHFAERLLTPHDLQNLAHAVCAQLVEAPADQLAAGVAERQFPQRAAAGQLIGFRQQPEQ